LCSCCCSCNESLSNSFSIYEDHFHPFLDPVNGNFLELPPAPQPEDFFASLNSYLEVILRATDEDGLTGETSVLLQPFLVEIQVTTNPAGLEVFVDDESVLALEEVWSWSEHDLKLKAENQPPYIFTSWSDGGTSAERTVRLNMTENSFLANYCVEDGGPCEIGTNLCCNYACNANGKCGDEEFDEGFSLTNEPGDTDETTPPADNPTNNDHQASSPPTNVEQAEDASNGVASPDTETSQESKKGASSAGKAILITVVLVLVACIGLFLFQKRNQERAQLSIRRATTMDGTSDFLDVEKLPTKNDVGELSSDDGHATLQTSTYQ
jgi:hypothetical protein